MSKFIFLALLCASSFSYSQTALNINKQQEFTSDGRINKTTKRKITYYSTVKWEVPTKQGGLLFGIARTKEEAIKIISDFNSRNKNNSHGLGNYFSTSKILHTRIKVYKTQNIYKEFFELNNKQYVILSKDMVTILDIYNNYDKEKGIYLLSRLKGISIQIAAHKISNINSIIKKFRA